MSSPILGGIITIFARGVQIAGYCAKMTNSMPLFEAKLDIIVFFLIIWISARIGTRTTFPWMATQNLTGNMRRNPYLNVCQMRLRRSELSIFKTAAVIQHRIECFTVELKEVSTYT